MKTDIKVIDKLFYRFKQLYGSNWCMLYAGPADMQAAKYVWLDKLKRYSPKQIGKGLELVKERHPHEPPKLFEFDRLCSSQKSRSAKRPEYKEWTSEPVKVADRAIGLASIAEMKETLGIK